MLAFPGQPWPIADPRVRAECAHISDKCHNLGHSLNLLNFMQNLLGIYLVSFQHSDSLDIHLGRQQRRVVGSTRVIVWRMELSLETENLTNVILRRSHSYSQLSQCMMDKMK
jgi:hypothetical protein